MGISQDASGLVLGQPVPNPLNLKKASYYPKPIGLRRKQFNKLARLLLVAFLLQNKLTRQAGNDFTASIKNIFTHVHTVD